MKRQNAVTPAGALEGDPLNDGREGGRASHVLLDVWSNKQGALRLQTIPFAVVLVALLGLYFCMGAILNYNTIDADQRDMITNMRIMLPGRISAHNIFKRVSKPESVGVLTDGTDSVASSVDRQVKSRSRLSDPRLLAYWEVVHPMVMMRQGTPIDWVYYTTKLPPVAFPPFRWDAELFLNISFKLNPNDILQAIQVINTWNTKDRPKISYFGTDLNGERVTTVSMELQTSIPAYHISSPDSEGNVVVGHVQEILIETRFDAIDVPATVVQRQTVYVPRLHQVTAMSYRQIYRGKWGPGAKKALAVPPEVELAIQIRDMQQPRPYAAGFTGFGLSFFVGFGFLIAALLLLLLWMCLRFYVVNKHVRENEGKPPMFYQGMLRFRGW